MTGVFASVTALLASVAILLVGHGLQLTLAPLYADSLQWSTHKIGYIGSAYFAGFVVGCLTVPRLVARVGHIRVFAVLVCAATAALLLLGLSTAIEVWLVARFITGWAFAGLYMVIESWLNERTTSQYRATVLSVYTIISLVAVCIGQLLVGVSANFVSLIILAAILLALGTIPVGLTRSVAPAPIPAVSFKFREVYDASRVAVTGAFAGGLVTAGFWAMGPVVAKAFNLEGGQIGLFMAIALLGGAVAQYPLGRLSDSMDRRIVLIGISIVGVAVCVGAFLVAALDSRLLYLVMFLFGASTFPIYSLCLAHANDNTELPLMQIASVILLTHSLGAVIGPIVVAQLMDYTSAGMFLFAAIILAMFALMTFWRVRVHEANREYFEPYQGPPRTEHGVAEIIQAEEDQLTK